MAGIVNALGEEEEEWVPNLHATFGGDPRATASEPRSYLAVPYAKGVQRTSVCTRRNGGPVLKNMISGFLKVKTPCII